MSLTTVQVTVSTEESGAVIVGAKVVATLNNIDIDVGYMIPKPVEGITDEAGIVVLNLWPNELGSTSTSYIITMTHPSVGKLWEVEAAIPNNDCNLWDVAATPPFPGQDNAAQAVLDAQTAQAAAEAAQVGAETAEAGAIAAQETAGVPAGGTAGQILSKIDGDDYNTQWGDVAGGGSLLASATVTGVATTQIDFTGLDINTHKSYRVELNLLNSAASNVLYYGYVNGDTNSANYKQIYHRVSSTGGVLANSLFDPRLNHITLSGRAVAINAFIQLDLEGRVQIRAEHSEVKSDSTINYSLTKNITFNVVQTNLTAFSIVSSLADGIGIGSTVRIYRGDQ